ncbi:MAG: hypothetical protein KGQ37_05420 [Hyphomicrobiales bacterium]|nr:hypothetical protein [Hyphomicrobiales bacterium]
MATFSIEPESRAMARALFETEWTSLSEIARQSGLSARSLGRYAEAEGWQRPGHGRAVDIRRRLRMQAENLLTLIEGHDAKPVHERLRDMAALTKILRDIEDLEAAPAPEAPAADPAALREELKARLLQLAAQEPSP